MPSPMDAGPYLACIARLAGSILFHLAPPVYFMGSETQLAFRNVRSPTGIFLSSPLSVWRLLNSRGYKITLWLYLWFQSSRPFPLTKEVKFIGDETIISNSICVPQTFFLHHRRFFHSLAPSCIRNLCGLHICGPPRGIRPP